MTRTILSLLALLVILVLAGCKDDRAPRLATRCVEQDVRVVLMPIFNGTTTHLMPTSQTYCVRREPYCRPAGEEYLGSLTCADILPGAHHEQ